MDIVAQEKKNSKRYLPHTVSTKKGAVLLIAGMINLWYGVLLLMKKAFSLQKARVS